MSTLRDDYDAWWRENPDPEPLPYLPFPQPYHNDPDAAFHALSCDAEARGYAVELLVGTERHGAPGYRYRKLSGIRVGPPNRKPVLDLAFADGESAGSAAVRARAQLESA